MSLYTAGRLQDLLVYRCPNLICSLCHAGALLYNTYGARIAPRACIDIHLGGDANGQL